MTQMFGRGGLIFRGLEIRPSLVRPPNENSVILVSPPLSSLKKKSYPLPTMGALPFFHMAAMCLLSSLLITIVSFNLNVIFLARVCEHLGIISVRSSS
jgi:hypothetical protein